ncbi:MAG: hypothetical protein ACRC5H_07065 [Treponemataceae bacterium]
MCRLNRRFCVVLFILMLFFGCKKNNAPRVGLAIDEKTNLSINEKTNTHRWFYFTKNSIAEIDSLNRIPLIEHRPWTEAVRISGATRTNNGAFFLVNRGGLLSLPASQAEKINLFTDAMIFSDFTADSLLSVDGSPVFKIYKNNFFNTEAQNSSNPFLIQYNLETNTFYPLLSPKDIELSETTQVVNIFFDGSIWTGSFKYLANERVLFDFIQFSTYNSLLSLKNIAKTGKIEKKYISNESYKAIAGPKPFSSAPAPLLKILHSVSANQPFMLSYSEINSPSPLLYVNTLSEKDDYLQAKSFFGKTFLVTVFSDGTTYFLGSLPHNPKNIIDAVKIFKLPKLPPNFVYSDIVCFGKMLYVGWEETFFYETGRSGFIAVDLESTLFD